MAPSFSGYPIYVERGKFPSIMVNWFCDLGRPKPDRISGSCFEFEVGIGIICQVCVFYFATKNKTDPLNGGHVSGRILEVDEWIVRLPFSDKRSEWVDPTSIWLPTLRRWRLANPHLGEFNFFLLTTVRSRFFYFGFNLLLFHILRHAQIGKGGKEWEDTFVSRIHSLTLLFFQPVPALGL